MLMLILMPNEQSRGISGKEKLPERPLGNLLKETRLKWEPVLFWLDMRFQGSTYRGKTFSLDNTSSKTSIY